MLTDLLFFLICGATLSLLVWSGVELFRNQEDPLGDRLEALQSQAMVVAARAERRKRTGRGLDRFLYLVGLVPGGDDWMRGTEKLLHQAGVRRKQALAVYTILVILFVLSLAAGLLLQRVFAWRVPVAALVLAAYVSPIPWSVIAYGRWVATYNVDRLYPGTRAESAVPDPKSTADTYCIYTGEGYNGTVAVTLQTDGVKSFHSAGKVQASNDPRDMRLQRMLGHISALAVNHPKKVLVVTVASGLHRSQARSSMSPVIGFTSGMAYWSLRIVPMALIEWPSLASLIMNESTSSG